MTLTRDPLDVILCDPGLPVLPQRSSSDIPVLMLTERPFVNDGVVACSVEQRGSDPWFSNEPLARFVS